MKVNQTLDVAFSLDDIKLALIAYVRQNNIVENLPKEGYIECSEVFDYTYPAEDSPGIPARNLSSITLRFKEGQGGKGTT